MGREVLRLGDVKAIEAIEGKTEPILKLKHLDLHQFWLAWAILRHKKVFLAAEMGLGKTAAVLLALRRILKAGKAGKVLIVAPLHVAEETWPVEIATWKFARKFTYAIMTGTPEQRAKACAKDVDIYLINPHNLNWLKSHVLRGWKWDVLVYDEASRLRGGKKKTKSRKMSEFGVLAARLFKFKYVIELSGTPATNGLIDLWGPIFLLDRGARLGDTKTAFLRRWFREDRYDYTITPFSHSKREIMAKLKNVMFSLRESDYLKLPPLIIRDRPVRLSVAEMKTYKRMVKDACLEEYDIEAVNSGVLAGKLLQFANGCMYDVEKNAVPFHTRKLAMLESIFEEAAGIPVLVAYAFKFDRDAIKKKFPWVRIFGEDPNDQKDWKAGKIKAMLVHPASAGHGLNIQSGGNIAVWYGLTWSLELYQQFVKRLHRRGQKQDRVFLYRIITEGTYDENLAPNLKMRGKVQDDITDSVRVLVKKQKEAA